MRRQRSILNGFSLKKDLIKLFNEPKVWGMSIYHSVGKAGETPFLVSKCAGPPVILYQTLNQGHLAQSKELYMVAQDRNLCFDQYEMIPEGL